MLTDQEKETVIENMVKEYIGKDEMFTSLDISNAIKNKGVWVRNIEVRNWLHANYGNDIFGDYNKTLIDVKGGTAQATLYFPNWKDPEDYEPTDQRALTPAEVDTIRENNDTDILNLLKTASKTTKKVKLNSSGVAYDERILDSTERLKIPTDFVEAMGYCAGDHIPGGMIRTHRPIPDRIIVSNDGRYSIPRDCIDWGTDPVKVIFDGKVITFKKA
jgi:hypothetical protein